MMVEFRSLTNGQRFFLTRRRNRPGQEYTLRTDLNLNPIECTKVDSTTAIIDSSARVNGVYTLSLRPDDIVYTR